jgi:predicted alpha/beta hydrolase
MDELFSFIGWILAIIGFIWLHTAFWTRHYRNRRHGDEIHHVATDDGWNLALHRYLPKKQKYQESLILVPGFCANRYNFDFDKDRSLAEHLVEQGFIVWILELRGVGWSKMQGRQKNRWDISFKDYIEQDAPAALATIRKVDDQAPIFWIGHSMGGLIGYVMAGSTNDDGKHVNGISGLITISSPIKISKAKYIKSLRPLIYFLSIRGVVPFRSCARFFSPFCGWPPSLLSGKIIRPDSVSGYTLRQCMVNLVDNTTAKVIRQFLHWSRSGSFESKDGQDNYMDKVKKIDKPVLIMACQTDHVAPPSAVIPAYENIPAEDKQLRVFGSDSGDDYDFGHGDVLLGDHSAEVVYPEISDWLTLRATPIESDSSDK